MKRLTLVLLTVAMVATLATPAHAEQRRGIYDKVTGIIPGTAAYKQKQLRQQEARISAQHVPLCDLRTSAGWKPVFERERRCTFCMKPTGTNPWTDAAFALRYMACQFDRLYTTLNRPELANVRVGPRNHKVKSIVKQIKGYSKQAFKAFSRPPATLPQVQKGKQLLKASYALLAQVTTRSSTKSIKTAQQLQVWIDGLTAVDAGFQVVNKHIIQVLKKAKVEPLASMLDIAWTAASAYRDAGLKASAAGQDMRQRDLMGQAAIEATFKVWDLYASKMFDKAGKMVEGTQYAQKVSSSIKKSLGQNKAGQRFLKVVQDSDLRTFLVKNGPKHLATAARAQMAGKNGKQAFVDAASKDFCQYIYKKQVNANIKNAQLAKWVEKQYPKVKGAFSAVYSMMFEKF
eukprot:TRINITY_DN4013_c0_g1_i1.p1 TRINITY_DN4013_c0_g1~~TRINITY_DN4013_c0_g1_i1.p1  ORF type:complete len:416 (+),score=219.95 TRINITY_DN4013_c0_g1_i1:43-1248(+)